MTDCKSGTSMLSGGKMIVKIHAIRQKISNGRIALSTILVVRCPSDASKVVANSALRAHNLAAPLPTAILHAPMQLSFPISVFFFSENLPSQNKRKKRSLPKRRLRFFIKTLILF
jgi:hypothetical protein